MRAVGQGGGIREAGRGRGGDSSQLYETPFTPLSASGHPSQIQAQRPERTGEEQGANENLGTPDSNQSNVTKLTGRGKAVPIKKISYRQRSLCAGLCVPCFCQDAIKTAIKKER